MSGGPDRFPFGREVRAVLPTASGPCRVFVLGVYPSAVHARWKDPSGRTWPALVVDNEPEPFWTGDDAEGRVASVAAEVPSEAGLLSAAGPDQNGPSGRVLDELYLSRLGSNGVSREECWITDLVQTYLASSGQLNRIRDSYHPLAQSGMVPAARLTPRGGPMKSLSPERTASLRRELDEASPDLLVTLGREPLDCLGLEPLRHDAYGEIKEVTVLGRTVPHLALVHPRQAGGLARHSPEWKATHLSWLEKSASRLIF